MKKLISVLKIVVFLKISKLSDFFAGSDNSFLVLNYFGTKRQILVAWLLQRWIINQKTDNLSIKVDKYCTSMVLLPEFILGPLNMI